MVKRKTTKRKKEGYDIVYWDEEIKKMNEMDYNATSPESAVRQLYNIPIEDVGDTDGFITKTSTGKRWKFLAFYDKSKSKHIGVKLTEVQPLSQARPGYLRRWGI